MNKLIYLILLCLVVIPLAEAVTTPISGNVVTGQVYKTIDNGQFYYTSSGSLLASLLSPETIYIRISLSSKCGSGTSNSWSYTTNTGRTGYGTLQISCTVPSTEWTKFVLDRVYSVAGVTIADTVYVNGVLYQLPKPTLISPIKNDVIQQINVVGATVKHIQVNVPVLLTSNISYPNLLDTNYNDGTYEQLYTAWFLLDIDGNVLKSSEFTPIVNNTVYTHSTQLTPYKPVYFFVSLIEKQNYNYEGGIWKMTENVAVQNAQQFIVSPSVTPTPTIAPPCIIDCKPPTKTIWDIIAGLIQGFWRLLGFQI